MIIMQNCVEDSAAKRGLADHPGVINRVKSIIDGNRSH